MAAQSENDSKSIAPATSHCETWAPDIKAEEKTILHVDAVFGELTEDGPNYRNVGWPGTAGLMMKIAMGLGVLSIPKAFNTLGLVPGTICLVLVGAISTWCGYEVGVFKLRHPEVYGVDDAGYLLFGPVGRDIAATAFVLCYIFVSGSGMLGISISLNALSSHGICTAVFVAVSAVASISLSNLQTLGRIQSLAWVGIASICIAVLVLTIAVGVQERPAEAPKDVPWKSDFKISASPSFSEAASALSAFIFAYAATPAFFPVVAEMRNPRDYPKALVACQLGLTVVYVVVGVVVYYYCGSYVASPALGSAGELMKKICYGIALPGLLVSATLSLHLASKYVFVRLLRNSIHLSSNSTKHWVSWISCNIGAGLVAYIIASAVPAFDNLVSLVGALLISVLAFQITGCMWLYDNWSKGKAAPTKSWYLMVAWTVSVVVLGTFLTISGTYGSIVEIIQVYKMATGSAAWSCADNSNSS